jgi:hypothetical protein
MSVARSATGIDLRTLAIVKQRLKYVDAAYKCGQRVWLQPKPTGLPVGFSGRTYSSEA